MVLQQPNEMNSSSSEHLKANKLFANNNHNTHTTNNLGSKKQYHSTMSSKANSQGHNQMGSNASNLKLDSINSLLASSSTNMNNKPSKIPVYNSTSFEKFKTSYNTNNSFINAKMKTLKSNSKQQFEQSPLLEQSILNFSSSQNGFATNTNVTNNVSSNPSSNRTKLEKQHELQPTENQPKKASIFQKTSKKNQIFLPFTESLKVWTMLSWN